MYIRVINKYGVDVGTVDKDMWEYACIGDGDTIEVYDIVDGRGKLIETLTVDEFKRGYLWK